MTTRRCGPSENHSRGVSTALGWVGSRTHQEVTLTSLKVPVQMSNVIDLVVERATGSRSTCGENVYIFGVASEVNMTLLLFDCFLVLPFVWAHTIQLCSSCWRRNLDLRMQTQIHERTKANVKFDAVQLNTVESDAK